MTAALWAIAFALILRSAEHADATRGLSEKGWFMYSTLLAIAGVATCMALVTGR